MKYKKSHEPIELALDDSGKLRTFKKDNYGNRTLLDVVEGEFIGAKRDVKPIYIHESTLHFNGIPIFGQRRLMLPDNLPKGTNAYVAIYYYPIYHNIEPTVTFLYYRIKRQK